MPFIPHTQADIAAMLAAIGASSIEELFDEIPAELRKGSLAKIPPGATEMEISQLMAQRATQDGRYQCYIGAGAYDHHIPAAVWQIATRGEFYSAYTPYQAEASQGTLQLLYEYQTMMASLTGMDVSNASLYEGGSALAEAVLMAVRANRQSKSKRILMPRTVHPNYRKVVATIVRNQNIEIIDVDFDPQGGHVTIDALDRLKGDDVAAVVIPQPNFFGVLENVDVLTDWAHANNALVIGLINPLAAALLKPPGQWGANGADIACGDGQPLGIPLSSGGPWFGFIACKQEHVRQMPGRIVGRTVDLDGKPGYTLTLQAREQHIRRSKATSNICTNQGLLVTAATIHMALLGPDGLERVARACHANTVTLADKLAALNGVAKRFDRPCFHETVLQFDQPVAGLLNGLRKQRILGGYDLGRDYPELGNALLVCATETKTATDIDAFVAATGALLTHG